MSSSTPEQFIWKWQSPKQGTLETIIGADGTVRQRRRLPRDTETSEMILGQITANRCQAVMSSAHGIAENLPPRPAGVAMIFTEPVTVETVSFRLRDGSSDQGQSVPVKELASHPEIRNLRYEVIAIRKLVNGGNFGWRSISGRLMWLLLFIMLCFAYWIVQDWRLTDRMQQLGERLEARVVARDGNSGFDKSKSITVAFTTSERKEREMKIAQYLSAENWELAASESSVRIWFDPVYDVAFTESDMLRWQRDKRSILFLPIGIALPILLICYLFRGHRVGVHDDGQEYLVNGDRVVSDDKTAIVNRTSVNLVRLVGWLVR